MGAGAHVRHWKHASAEIAARDIHDRSYCEELPQTLREAIGHAPVLRDLPMAAPSCPVRGTLNV